MPAARQICRASSTIAATATLTACPVCGRKVKPREYARMLIEAVMHLRPVVPAHPRDTHGEMRVRMDSESTRYPGSGYGR